MVNYGFIGAGNMAASLIKGALLKNTSLANQIYIYNKNNLKQENFCKAYGLNSCTSMDIVAKKCDIILICVKPQNFNDVLSTLLPILPTNKPLIVSIAGAITILDMENMLSSSVPIARSMPSLNSEVGYGCSAICYNTLATDTQKKYIEDFFSLSGTITQIEEQNFSIYTSIASCSSAYVYMFIDALATAGLKHGLKKEEALKMASSAVLGSSCMLINSNAHPSQLIDRVCSPGGITIEGVCTLKENLFESTIIKAVDATVNKDKTLK
jgi:pyrroline-5-carboxylate reductase